MDKEILIIGGGLSGLAAARQLNAKGIDFLLLEARERLGGRILAHKTAGNVAYDLGPSWFWPGQPLIADLVKEFGLEVFSQYTEGRFLFEDEQGRRGIYPFDNPMAGALRIAGGLSEVIAAVAGEIAPDRIRLSHRVIAAQMEKDGIRLDAEKNGQTLSFKGRHLVIAIPPRLAAGKIQFNPGWPETSLKAFQDIPTWMAGQAKALALYSEPFWRAQDFSGSAMSRYGPLGEIHDASPKNGGPFALFGFFGIPATIRQQAGHADLKDATLQQLARLFGQSALEPVDFIIQDWSGESHTATAEDLSPSANGHEVYGRLPSIPAPWQSKISFISSETARLNGGLLEGALESAKAFVTSHLERD